MLYLWNYSQKCKKMEHLPLKNVPFAKYSFLPIWRMVHFSVANVPFLCFLVEIAAKSFQRTEITSGFLAWCRATLTFHLRFLLKLCTKRKSQNSPWQTYIIWRDVEAVPHIHVSNTITRNKTFRFHLWIWRGYVTKEAKKQPNFCHQISVLPLYSMLNRYPSWIKVVY